MANYMADVAKLLGVEIGEEFDVCFDNSNVYMNAQLTENGFKVNDTNMVALVPHSSIQVFEWILCGLATIKRKPWKPKINDAYWFICVDKSAGRREFERCPLDIYNYKLGNCYRTEKEAISNRDKWVSFYGSDEVLEV